MCIFKRHTDLKVETSPCVIKEANCECFFLRISSGFFRFRRILLWVYYAYNTTLRLEQCWRQCSDFFLVYSVCQQNKQILIPKGVLYILISVTLYLNLKLID